MVLSTGLAALNELGSFGIDTSDHHEGFMRRAAGGPASAATTPRGLADESRTRREAGRRSSNRRQAVRWSDSSMRRACRAGRAPSCGASNSRARLGLLFRDGSGGKLQVHGRRQPSSLRPQKRSKDHGNYRDSCIWYRSHCGCLSCSWPSRWRTTTILAQSQGRRLLVPPSIP